MSARKIVWKKIGYIAYFTLMPLIRIYASSTKPRARVIVTHEDDVLVVKNWLGGDGWALPGGGLEEDEEPIDAAVREIKEELGIELVNASLEYLGEHESVERMGLHSKYYLFIARLDKKPSIRLREYEIMDAKWISKSKLFTAEKGVANTVKDSIRVWTDSTNLVS